MVSIACCFIQREVQIEILLSVISLIKRLKCCRSLKCIRYLENNFIPSLRLNDKRAAQTSHAKTKPKIVNDAKYELRRSSTNMLLDFEYKPNDFKRFTSLRANSNANNQSRVITRQPSKFKMRSKSTDSKSSDVIRKICCCLLTNQKNDFHQNSSRKQSQFPNNGTNSKKKKLPKNFSAPYLNEENTKELITSDESKNVAPLLNSTNLKNKKDKNLEKFLEYSKHVNLKAGNEEIKDLIKSIDIIEQGMSDPTDLTTLNIESHGNKKNRNSI